jgi:DNA polymerase III subunit beta
MLEKPDQQEKAQKLLIKRDNLLKALQKIIGVVERRHTKAILANLLMDVEGQKLTLTGTDLALEMKVNIEMENSIDGFNKTTIPARKFLDICRTLPEDSNIELAVRKDKVGILCGKSRFTLATLPAADFPAMPTQKSTIDFHISQNSLKILTEKTYFAIPEQDVRNYLNGLVLEVKDGAITATASDSHRLALYKESLAEKDLFVQVIIPRRGVAELTRLLEPTDEKVQVSISNNNICISGSDFVLSSILIAAKFPNYSRMIPRNWTKKITLNRDEFRMALMRVAILANEFSRSINIQLQRDLLCLSAHNPENEEADEVLSVDYAEDEEIDVSFNAGYLLDALHGIDTEQVVLAFKDSNGGVIIEEAGNDNCLYLIMPIKK